MQKINDYILHKKTESEVVFEIKIGVYSLEAIYQTAYVFTKEAYIVLDGNPNKNIVITLLWKKPQKNISKNIVGMFMNELLNQTVRNIVSSQNIKEKELIMSKVVSMNLNL